MQFSTTSLPELGSEVWFAEGDATTGRVIIRSGLVFAQLLRYKLGPLILVDVEAIEPTDMDQHDTRLNKYNPERLFDSVSAVGASLTLKSICD